MYDNGNERNQEYVYRTFGHMSGDDQPTFGNNITYFLDYQFRWMYWRYFMWNFAGKQNDLQGFGNRRDGNWNSGISFIDKMFGHSTPDELPETAGAKNKANNKLFFLPFILGVVGFAFQLNRNKRDFLINFLLFFFTGLAIVIYLNQAGQQPRERDYAYVGSFYAFAIWIGLGVIFLKELIGRYVKGAVGGYAAIGLSLLAVPVLMGAQEWDDHDRSKKTLARDIGKDYLESCDKNGILISFGDNDTYPLWYSQEVEKIRPDLRVINYSLLGTDWYINELRYKVNESDPTDVIFTKEQIEGDNRNVVFTGQYLTRSGYTAPLAGYDQNKYYDLYDVLKNVTASNDPKYQLPLRDDDMGNILPVNKLSVPVDVEYVKQHMQFNAGDSIVSELKLDIKRGYLQKNDLAVLAIIAGNKWKRPIYFTSTQELEDLGLEKYVRMEGLSYRLVPVEGTNVQMDVAYKNMMEKFAYGGANKAGTYFDEENRRHINSLRQAHGFLGMALVDAGRLDSARKELRKYDGAVLESNCPYGMTSNRGNFHNRVTMTYLYAAYKAEDQELAKKVSQSVKSDLEQQLKYYRTMGDQPTNEAMAMQASQFLNNKPNGLSDKQGEFAQDIMSSYQMLMQLTDWEKTFGPASKNAVENAPTALPTPDSPKK
jgi:hypothetical protein